MWPISKVSSEFAATSLLLYVFIFWPQVVQDLGSPTKDQTPAPSALEGEVLSTGPPGKSDYCYFSYLNFNYIYLEVDV